jgi:hypothetical protein
MVHFDDIKVLGANTICMVLAKIQNINDSLQSILFFATIAYTIIRTINEINKFKKNGKANSTDESSSSQD